MDKRKKKRACKMGRKAISIIIAAVLILSLASCGKGQDSDSSSEAVSITTYEIFGDGKLIKEPQRLKATASGDDNLSTSALIGPWEGTRSRINTEYGFSDDGYFYKNVMINNSYISSTYHPGYTSYGSYYNTYYSGYWTYQTNISYTYLDTLVGEYKVKGGVIQFDHVVAISHTSFEDDWYYAKTRSVSIEQLQKESKNAKMQDDFSEEFEFISPTRIRLRDDNTDIDLFWDIEDDPHDVKIPKHEIPAVDWPKKALSSDMPEIKTKGRIREASLSYSGDDKNIKSEFKTVTVVIDKTDALSEIEAYGKSLQKSGWWVEDYELGSEDTSLSYQARKGMFKLNVSNGNGSGTGADTIVIESTKYPEGQWPKQWTKAGLESPDKSVIVGDVKVEPNDDKDIYETLTFDKVDDSGVKAYYEKLARDGFKKPQHAYEDSWEMMKYIRIDKDLYLVEITMDQRMDSLTSFTYDLEYVPDGVWPESWKKGGLPAPEGIDTIAGAIDAEAWAEHLIESASDYASIKFLGLDPKEIDAYLNKLKSSGFTQIKDEYSKEIRLYAYLRIDGKMLRVEVSPVENEDIAEISYYFQYFEDGKWPESWQNAGLPVPEGAETIVGSINLEEWRESLTEYGFDYESIKFLGLDTKEAESYLSKLKSLGFKQTEDDWNDSIQLYNYLHIDGLLCRVEIEPTENDELTEFSYSFRYSEGAAWPDIWRSAGLPAPEGMDSVVSKFNLEEWRESLTEYGSSRESIEFLGLDARETENYLNKLKSLGFKLIEDDWSDSIQLYNYLRIDGLLCRVEIEQMENDELTEFYYSFEYFEDGAWPSQWVSAGIPAPAFTAMLGKIDTAEFNENLSDWGSYSVSIKLMGARLTDYAAILRQNGFSVSEYSYVDTWELEKRVSLNGKRFTVTIEDADNAEIPEIRISFSGE